MENYKQRYTKALERAKEELGSGSVNKGSIEYIFPELTENEDERVRKELIKFLNDVWYLGKNTNFNKWSTSDCSNWINWVQKQGKQKPASKFKVGDFVVINGFVLKILNVRNDLYETEFLQTGEFRVYDTYVLDNDAHIWTIQDAKIGDILATNDSIFMFKEIYMCNKPEAFCGLMTASDKFVDKDCSGCWTNNECWPATKEQRELLFKKMKEHDVALNDKTPQRTKFNVGDWLQYRNAKPFLVKEITEQGYANGRDCIPFSWENEIHRWTIKDARDGDILDFGFGAGVGIFKCVYDNYYVICHCSYNYDILDVDTRIPYDIHTTRPATKEQCETLRSHILEYGYMWDDKAKELKKRNTPKFKKDDYIVDAQGRVRQIERVVENVTDNTYGYDLTDGGYINDETDNVHRWTIADARDGDVLADVADGETCIFIFKNIRHATNAIKTYCTFFTDGTFDNGCILYADIDNTRPATKEQRMMLFSHILENGYIWDDKAKELRQNDIDKPMFNVGDWIASGYGNAYVSAVNDTNYTLLFEDGLSDNLSIKNINMNWHHWTIDDAKPGDMLASEGLYPCDTDVPNSFVAIYKGINDTWPNRFDSYCFVSYSGKFITGTCHESSNIHPATKQQRELLCSKMNEAGYEWDVENMQLREKCDNEDE